MKIPTTMRRLLLAGACSMLLSSNSSVSAQFLSGLQVKYEILIEGRTTNVLVSSASGAIEYDGGAYYLDIFDLDSDNASILIQGDRLGTFKSRPNVLRFSLSEITGDAFADASLASWNNNLVADRLVWTPTTVSFDVGGLGVQSTHWWRVDVKKVPGFRKPPALITVSDPAAETILEGQNAFMAIKAAGNGPVTYSWFSGLPPTKGQILSTNESLAVEAGSSSSNYWVEVANPFGTTNRSFTVNVIREGDPPEFTTLAADPGLTVEAGQSLTLTATASGSPPLSYVWSNADLSIMVGTNLTSLILPSVQVSTSYWVHVQNAFGSDHHQFAITVTHPPQIQVQPADQWAFVGDPVTLELEASGGAPLAFQLFSGALPIVGAQAPQFTTPPLNNRGTNYYHLIVTNEWGSATSRVAVVRVVGYPQLHASLAFDGLLRIEANTKPGTTWHIQRSEDLATWQTLQDLTMDATGFGTVLLQPQLMQKAFFRLQMASPSVSALPPPVPLSPSCNSSGVSFVANLNWTKVLEATQYQLEISADSEGNQVHHAEVTETNYYYDLMVPNRMYYWRVKAEREQQDSDWSAWCAFLTAFYSPSTTFPDCQASGVSTTPTFTWNATLDATRYRLQVHDASRTLVKEAVVNGLSYQLTDPLQPNQEYSWTLRAESDINTGYWQMWCPFTTGN